MVDQGSSSTPAPPCTLFDAVRRTFPQEAWTAAALAEAAMGSREPVVEDRLVEALTWIREGTVRTPPPIEEMPCPAEVLEAYLEEPRARVEQSASLERWLRNRQEDPLVDEFYRQRNLVARERATLELRNRLALEDGGTSEDRRGEGAEAIASLERRAAGNLEATLEGRHARTPTSPRVVIACQENEPDHGLTRLRWMLPVQANAVEATLIGRLHSPSSRWSAKSPLVHVALCALAQLAQEVGSAGSTAVAGRCGRWMLLALEVRESLPDLKTLSGVVLDETCHALDADSLALVEVGADEVRSLASPEDQAFLAEALRPPLDETSTALEEASQADDEAGRPRTSPQARDHEPAHLARARPPERRARLPGWRKATVDANCRAPGGTQVELLRRDGQRWRRGDAVTRPPARRSEGVRAWRGGSPRVRHHAIA